MTETSPETIEPVPALLDEADMDSGRQSADGEEVVVTGYRPTGDSGGSGGGGGGGGGLHPPEDGDASITPGEPTGPPPPPEMDCRDRNAVNGAEKIKARSEQSYEYGVFVYRTADGTVQHTSEFRGSTERLTQTDIEIALKKNGLSFSQVIGFLHNHPWLTYGGAGPESPRVNRYPSDNDWNAADWMVRNGAGGPGGSQFAMYLLDTNNVLREFDYSDRERYATLNNDDKDQGDNLPPEIRADGSAC